MKEYEAHCKNLVMSRILEVRYTDLAEEKALCQDLLKWAETEGDVYGRAFARIYLGDYFVAQNDYRHAIFHLDRGGEILEKSGLDYPELMLRMYSLRAICFEMQADEQSATEYYLKAITLARRVGDTVSEGMVLNNLAFSLQHHHCYEEAYDYYKKVYAIYQKGEHADYLPIVLSNLTELCVSRGRLDQAKVYLDKCDELVALGIADDDFAMRNRCCYYSAVGEKAIALQCADWVVEHEDRFLDAGFTAFENYDMFCKSMMRIGEQEYAHRFLLLMEATSNGGLNHLKIIQKRKMEYCLQFEPEERQVEEYREYYRKAMEYKKLNNQTIIGAMKAKIDLDKALQQKESLQTEREFLERQVNLDELTQLYNRRFLDQLMQKFAEKAACGISVIMLDVDYFKEYNDFYGHADGDTVLQTIARCLQRPNFKNIYACRFGGDEFTCVSEGLSEEQLEQYIREVRADLAAYAVPHEKSHCNSIVTLSIGCAMGEPEKACDPFLLHQLADQAMYHAKISGRDTYQMKRAVAI